MLHPSWFLFLKSPIATLVAQGPFWWPSPPFVPSGAVPDMQPHSCLPTRGARRCLAPAPGRLLSA